MGIAGLHVENIMGKAAKREVATVTIDMVSGAVIPSGIDFAGVLFFVYMSAQPTHYRVVFTAFKPFGVEIAIFIIIDMRTVNMSFIGSLEIAVFADLSVYFVIVRYGESSPVMRFCIYMTAD